MNSLDDVAEFSMSGRRSVFTLKPGTKLDSDAIADAYDEVGLKFESVTQETRPKASTYYVANAGIT